MKYSIVAISFLNTIPLVDRLKSLPSHQIDLKFTLPSRLSDLLRSGVADVALVPIVEVFRGCAAGLVPGIGIACRGPADSVKMFHHGPISDLKRVYADRGSRSSVALLSVLLKEIHGLEPLFEKIEPVPGVLPAEGEGILVIGDRCFEYEKHLPPCADCGIQSMDLGEAWWGFTGLPFVFAAWAVSHDFRKRASSAEIGALVHLLTAARDEGLDQIDRIAAREAALGRLGHKGEAKAEAVAYYFRESLTYRLGKDEMAGMACFHELCIANGLVPDGPLPLIL